MPQDDTTVEHQPVDGGKIRIVTRGRIVHLEVTDVSGKMVLVRMAHDEIRRLVPDIKTQAYKAELASCTKPHVQNPLLSHNAET